MLSRYVRLSVSQSVLEGGVMRCVRLRELQDKNKAHRTFDIINNFTPVFSVLTRLPMNYFLFPRDFQLKMLGVRASCKIPGDKVRISAKALWQLPVRKRSTKKTLLPFLPRNQYRNVCRVTFSSFQVEYDFAGSILHVTIVKCEDLAAMDIGGTSDPYVKVYLLPDRKRKQVRNFRGEGETNSLGV